MSRLSLLLIPLLAVAVAAADDKPTQAALDAQILALTPRIEKARGLSFRKPVVGKLKARPKDPQWQGIQGYYDSKTKELVVFDDIASNYRTGTLVHEMVHALQDQHFGLARQDDAPLDGDAALARAALIEGDATLVMIRVLEKEQPHVAFMLRTTLEKRKNLRNAFLYGLGAKYVDAVQKKGGWAAVDMRYGFPPQTTAAVLHPDEKVIPVNLGPGTSVGEFGIVRMFAASKLTQPDCAKAASGWRGDRKIAEADGSAGWVVAFDKEEQAGTFYSTLLKLRKEEHPVGKAAESAANRERWDTKAGKVAEVRLVGKRVYDLLAPDAKAVGRLIDRIEGPPRYRVYDSRAKKYISPGELTDRLLAADIVCVGETHDSELHHKIQLEIIKSLFARDERLGVGMEMFQKPFQKSLDRYVAGAIDEATFLEDTEYKKRWGFDWSLYRDIVGFCRRNAIPLAALNVSDDLRRKVSRLGFDKLAEEDKKALGAVDFGVKPHREYWMAQFAKMKGHGEMTPESTERFYRVMTVWDEYMADSAAKFQTERKVRRMVILAGSGHIERGFGIPDRAAKRTGGKAVTVGVVVGERAEKVEKEAATDYVLIAE